MASIDKVLGLLGIDDAAAISAISHGTTVATNQLLEGNLGPLGFITTEGYEFVLEIARQSVPDGYGNSYFWRKPPRIVAGRPGADGRRAPGLHRCRDPPVRRGERGGGRAGSSASGASSAIGVCLLHSYADPAHEIRVREILHREYPEAIVSISSDVLREYREYERSMTTLVDAAVKPLRVALCLDDPPPPGRPRPGRPVLRDEVQRGSPVGRRGRAPADHHRAVRAGGRRARRGAHRAPRRIRQGAHLRRRRHVHRRVGRPRRRADADHRGLGRQLPVEDPDDRRGHGRRGRGLDRLGVAGGRAQGRPAIGGRRPGTALLRARRRGRHGHRRARRARADPARISWVARFRWMSRQRAGGFRRSPAGSASRSRPVPPAFWRSRRGTRPTRCARSRSSAAWTCATSRWSRSAARARCCCAG